MLFIVDISSNENDKNAVGGLLEAAPWLVSDESQEPGRRALPLLLLPSKGPFSAHSDDRPFRTESGLKIHYSALTQ